MNLKSLKPYAQAILDHHSGTKEAHLIIERDDGHTESLDVNVFFRGGFRTDTIYKTQRSGKPCDTI